MFEEFKMFFCGFAVAILDVEHFLLNGFKRSKFRRNHKKFSFTSFRNLETSSVKISVNSDNFSFLAALCFACSWHDPKIPLSLHSPVARAIPEPNNPTEASAIIATGAALGKRLCPEVLSCSVFRKDEV